MSYYSEDDWCRDQVGGCSNMTLFEVNRKEREERKDDKRLEKEHAKEREILENVKTILRCIKNVDENLQKLNSAYGEKLLNIVSIIINDTRFLYSLEQDPEKTITGFNNARANRGDPPMAQKEVEIFIHQQIIDCKKAEITTRKEWIQYLKFTAMQDVDNQIKFDKELLDSN